VRLSDDAGDCPSDLEPGTCYVASLPWKTSNDRATPDTSQTALYLLACPNGCTEWPYQRRTKRIKNPWLYTCPECDTTLVSCDGRDTPTRFDPGSCNVENIHWSEPQIIHACQRVFQPRLRPTPRQDPPSQPVQVRRLRYPGPFRILPASNQVTSRQVPTTPTDHRRVSPLLVPVSNGEDKFGEDLVPTQHMRPIVSAAMERHRV
jgi:hypothetical protein